MRKLLTFMFFLTVGLDGARMVSSFSPQAAQPPQPEIPWDGRSPRAPKTEPRTTPEPKTGAKKGLQKPGQTSRDR